VRSVEVGARNGGEHCEPTEELAECAPVPCFVYALNQTLVDDCGLANPLERLKALRIIWSVGVESAADMCHLGRDDLQFRSLKPPPQPALMELSGAVPGGMALADTAQVLTLLPITEKKLVSCICTKLCGNAAPICNSGSPDDDLSNWLQTKCGFAETDLAEILGALRGAGARKTRDLRFLQDATVAELAGVPHEGHRTLRHRRQPRLGFCCLLLALAPREVRALEAAGVCIPSQRCAAVTSRCCRCSADSA
jgi:hypothetical protein